MTPKEKAVELVDKYLDMEESSNLDLFCDECGMSTDVAKLCALIALQEMIEYLIEYKIMIPFSHYEYWLEVKKEIKKL